MKKVFIITAVLGVIVSIFIFSRLKNGGEPAKGQLCKDCNVILVSMTNLRYDHMSSNGYSRTTTPNLDKLSQESLVFDNAFGHSSWTLPESISIYTGLYPFQHGIMDRYDGSTLSKNTPTLIDILKQAGYKTAGFTGGFDYNRKFGLTGRFDEYSECNKEQTVSYSRLSNSVVGGPAQYGELTCTVPKAIEWLKKNASKKFFLHVQGFDAHCPFSQNGGKLYDPSYKGSVDFSECLWTFERTDPIIKDGKIYYAVHTSGSFSPNNQPPTVFLSQEDISHLLAIYDEGIRSADEQIGSLISEVYNLGLNNKTVIIFTSEHGDMFGKYGRFMRGGPLRGTFYDDVLHIPLLIKDPKLTQKHIKGLVEQVDLLPTIINLLGLQAPDNISGKSLTPLILAGKGINQYVFAGSIFTPNSNNIFYSKKTGIETVRSRQWKLITETIFNSDGTSSKSAELYDIAKDKEELSSLVNTRPDMLKQLQTILSDWAGNMLK